MYASIENSCGTITVSNDVLSSLTGEAAMACYGVVGMATRNKADGFASLLKKSSAKKGIMVLSEEDGLVIELHVIVQYGVNIKTISDSIIERVRYDIENMSGFKVKAVNVNVESVRVS